MRLYRIAIPLVLAAAGCKTTGFPDVVDATQLPTSFGPPTITRIRDAGSATIPESGRWSGESDGIAVPGELIIIEGENFGRLPTVSIGGRATTIIARTDGGGIIARVPTGVPVGDVPISVSQPKGRAQRSFALRRFAVVVHDGQLYTLTVDRDAALPVGKPLPVAGARSVRISSDGSVAYVLATRPDGDQLVVVDLAAANGPRVGVERKLAHHGALLAAALDVSLMAVVGDGQVTLVQTHNPRLPRLYEPMDLPMGAKGPRAIELSPDGRLLALLVAEGNRLLAVDVSAPPTLNVVTAIDLLPDVKLSLVRDLAFTSDGGTLWIVSGDNRESLPALQPTRLTAVRILVKPDGTAENKEHLVSLWRTLSVPGAAAPIHLAIAHGQPTASGTTIRLPPEKAAVFVSSLSNALFKLAEIDLTTASGAKAAQKLWRPPQPGIMVRADVNGGGGPMFTTPELMSSIDLTPDAQLVVATAARVTPAQTGATVDFGVVYAPIFRAQQTPVFVPLGSILPRALKPPFLLGEVRIQP
jgi:hypothetical protein